MKNLKIAVALLIAGLLLGCKPDAQPLVAVPPTDPPAIPVFAPPISPTPAEWKAALNSTFIASGQEDKGDGVTTFLACFDQKPKCESFAFAKRDAFQKSRIFRAGLYSNMDVLTYLKTSVILMDNQLPSIALQPYFFGKNGWIFMNKFAIMADGEIIFERAFENHEVSRETSSIGVEESAVAVITHLELAALRSMADAKTIMIRFNGSKGYVSLKPGDVAKVKGEVANALFIYEKLTNALSGHIPFEPALPK